jgi:hypothetical protein
MWRESNSDPSGVSGPGLGSTSPHCDSGGGGTISGGVFEIVEDDGFLEPICVIVTLVRDGRDRSDRRRQINMLTMPKVATMIAHHMGNCATGDCEVANMGEEIAL